VTALPWLARPFGFAPLSPGQWLAAFAAGLAMVLPFQASKGLPRRWPLHR